MTLYFLQNAYQPPRWRHCPRVDQLQQQRVKVMLRGSRAYVLLEQVLQIKITWYRVKNVYLG